MLFMTAPELYIQKFIEKRDTQGQVDALNAQPVQGEGVRIGDAAQAFGAIPAQGGGGENPTDTGQNGITPVNFTQDRHTEFIRGFGGGGTYNR